MKFNKIYDLIIIGAGPAGLSASIYSSRYGIGHLVIGKIIGGQISETHNIDNYPGMEDMSGFEFSEKWGHHVAKYGINVISEIVKSIKKAKNSQNFLVELENSAIYEAKAILLATGTKRRKLDIAGEDKFFGKGVSYCATCDGFFYKGKTVAVIGGGDSAAGAALYLANIAEYVYLVYRGGILKCEPFWLKAVENNPKIKIIYNTNVVEIMGDDKLKKVKLDQNFNGSIELIIDGLFIEAGSDPDVTYANDLGLKLDDQCYVKVNGDNSTNVSGIWAAGDITDGSDKFRQVITAAAEGAIAARSIFNWLKKK